MKLAKAQVLATQQFLILTLFGICSLFGIPLQSYGMPKGEYQIRSPLFQGKIENFSDPLKIENLENFLNEVSRLLPEGMIRDLRSPVRLEWANFKGQNELPSDPCRVNHFKVGRSSSLFHVIQMNRLLLDEIGKGPSQSILFSCHHGNYYRFAQATLVHELAHLYDDRREVSREKGFLNLAGWSEKGLVFRTRSQGNVGGARSPDVYEYKSPSEGFAVNMEYFLLDAEYACRRPLLYEYFKNHFQHVPFTPLPCRVNPAIITQPANMEVVSYKPIEINPEQVYQIHYFFATRGGGIESSQGHAMFRIVLCRPNRLQKGPECLREDLDHHIVLSYRAKIDNSQLGHYIKGVNGGYPSQLFILPMKSVIDEYKTSELRDLISLPLRLTEDEKRLFVYHALEQYWQYQGRYYFLTKNCATESMNFLERIIDATASSPSTLLKGSSKDPRDTWNLNTDHIETPIGMYHKLIELGMIDPTGVVDSDGKILNEKVAKEEGYYFKSVKKELKSNFDNLISYAEYLPYKSYNDFVLQSTPWRRLQAFQRMMIHPKLTDQEKSRALSSFLYVELYILRMKIGNHIRNIATLLSNDDESIPEELRKLKKTVYSTTPLKIALGSYGIPLASEFNPFLPLTTDQMDQTKVKEFDKKLAAWEDEVFSESIKEIQECQRNEGIYRLEMKELIRRNPNLIKALPLPGESS